MERTEELLRDELRRTTGPLPPGRDVMVARVVAARRRRVAVGAALAVVLFGAVASTASVFIVGAARGIESGSATTPRLHQNELVNVVFTDPAHGYVVQQRCTLDEPGPVPAGAPTPDIHQDCRSQLLVTADGGLTWQERDLPAEPATKDSIMDLTYGHSLMLWVHESGALAFGSWDRLYWTTVDSGQTWQQSPTPREIGPAGSLAAFTLDDRLTFLATGPGAPHLVHDTNPLVPATDGSYWLTCGGDPCVYVTRDHGQTWQTLAPVGAATRVEWVATVDGQQVYAGVRVPGGTRLARSTDGGATWTEVPGLADAAPKGAKALALPNGDLLLAQTGPDGGLRLLRAGTTVLEPVTGAPAVVMALYRTGGVIVAAQIMQQSDDPNLSSIVSVSSDATTWHAVPPPPG